MLLCHEHGLVKTVPSFEMNIRSETIPNAIGWGIDPDCLTSKLPGIGLNLMILANSRRTRRKLYKEVRTFGVLVVSTALDLKPDLSHDLWEALIQIAEKDEVEVSRSVRTLGIDRDHCSTNKYRIDSVLGQVGGHIFPKLLLGALGPVRLFHRTGLPFRLGRRRTPNNCSRSFNGMVS